MVLVSAAVFCVMQARLVAAVERGAITWEEANQRMLNVWVR